MFPPALITTVPLPLPEPEVAPETVPPTTTTPPALVDEPFGQRPPVPEPVLLTMAPVLMS